MKKRLFVTLFILLTINIKAQFYEVFSAAQQDAEKLVTEFTNPLFKGVMYATNAGWYNSAKTLKPYKFELKINTSAAFVPKKYETFFFDENSYNYLKLDYGPDELPTIMGGDATSHLIVALPGSNSETEIYEFDAPDGIKDALPLNIIPAPSLQLSMGFLLNSEVQLRYIPNLEKDGGYINLLGVGLKHNISQYFSKDKKNNNKKDEDKIFNLSVQVMYQNIGSGYDDSGDKGIKLNINSFSYQAIASLDYKLLSFYSAVGYTNATTTLDVLGDYDYTYTVKDSNGNVIGTNTITITDPLSMDYNTNGMNATFGVKLNLMFLRFFADYTIQEFPVINAGIGVKF